MAKNNYNLSTNEMIKESSNTFKSEPDTPSDIYGEDLAAYMIYAYLNGEY